MYLGAIKSKHYFASVVEEKYGIYFVRCISMVDDLSNMILYWKPDVTIIGSRFASSPSYDCEEFILTHETEDMILKLLGAANLVKNRHDASNVEKSFPLSIGIVIAYNEYNMELK